MRGTELGLAALPAKRRLFLLAKRDVRIAFARRTILQIRITHTVFNMNTAHRLNLARPRRIPSLFHARRVHAEWTRRPRKRMLFARPENAIVARLMRRDIIAVSFANRRR